MSCCAEKIFGGLNRSTASGGFGARFGQRQCNDGQALDAKGRPQEALPYYQKALLLAQTRQPQFQQSLIKALEDRLGAKRP